MNVIERYIFKRVSLIFAAACLSILAIAWTTQVLKHINLVTDTGQSALAFLEFATLILPAVIPEVVPFAVAIGVAQTLMTMNADSELVVINAAGSPRSTIAKPVVLVAIGACILAFVVHNFVQPSARQRARELVSTARADLITSVIKEGIFSKITDGLYLQIGERLPDGRLGSVFVSDSRQKNIDLIYYAKTASIARQGDDSYLLMQDGEVHRRQTGEQVSIIRFTSYAFDLSQFTQSSQKKPLLYPKDRFLKDLLNPDPNDGIYKATPQQFRSEIHKRFSTWLYPLAFALIALAIAGDARSQREARLNPMVATIVLSLLVRWAGFFSFSKADVDPAYEMTLYFVPIATCVIATYFYYSGQKFELSRKFAEKMQDFQRMFGQKLMTIRLFAWIARAVNGPEKS